MNGHLDKEIQIDGKTIREIARRTEWRKHRRRKTCIYTDAERERQSRMEKERERDRKGRRKRRKDIFRDPLSR